MLCIIAGLAVGFEALSSAVVGFWGALLLSVKILVFCAMCYIGWNWFSGGPLAFRWGACGHRHLCILYLAFSFPFGIKLLPVSLRPFGIFVRSFGKIDKAKSAARARTRVGIGAVHR